jgi:hypothetical protein
MVASRLELFQMTNSSSDAQNVVIVWMSVPNKAIQPSAEDGTPVIFAEEAACQLCEDLPCIAACGTEALMPVPSYWHGGHGVGRGVSLSLYGRKWM